MEEEGEQAQNTKLEEQNQLSIDTFANTHVFVLGEENGTLPTVLKDVALSVTASFYEGIEAEKFRKRLEEKGTISSSGSKI